MSGGGSKSVDAGTWFYVAYHHGLSLGPIDALLDFRAGPKVAWSGELTASGAISINKPGLLGGEKDQGGLVGTLRVMFGEAGQEPNAYLTSVFGVQTVPWCGFATVAWEGGKYGANNPYPQKASYKIRKIKKGWDNDTCWYPEKAEIVAGFSELIPPSKSNWRYLIVDLADSTNRSAIGFDDSAWPVGAAPFGDETSPLNPGPSDYGFNNTPATIVPETKKVWLRTVVNIVGAPTHPFQLRCFIDNSARIYVNGVQVAEVGDLVGAFGYNEVEIPASAFVSGDNVVAVEAWDPHGGVGDYFYFDWTLTTAPGSFKTMNPAHILYFLRTSAERGREPIDNMADDNLRAAADWFYSKGFGLCGTRKAASVSPAEYEQHICQISGCSFTRSVVDGKWYIDIANGEYDLESLPVLTDDNILSFEELPTVLDNAINSVSVRYFDPDKNVAVVSPPVRALALIAAFGENHQTFDYPEIPTAQQANEVALRELMAAITPTRRFNLDTDTTPGTWRRYEYFRLQLPKRGIADMVCLAGEITHGKLKSGGIKLAAMQDTWSAQHTTYVAYEPGVDTRPSQTPKAVTVQRAIEAPYLEVCRFLSRADLAALPDDVGYLVGLAVDPAQHRDFTMFVEPDGGEYAETSSGSFCPTATVNEAGEPDATQTDFTLDAGVALDQVQIGEPVLWAGDAGDGSDDEWCRVDALDAEAGTISLGRGCADTVAGTHAAGGRLFFYRDAGALDTTEYTDGETIAVKLAPNTSSDQLPLTSAVAMALTFEQRQFRPYPPAALTLNAGAYPYPATINGTIAVAWSHRDRAMQADQLVDGTAASIGPEDGTTYTLEIYNRDDGSLVHSETGIVGDSTSVTAAQRTVRNRLEVFSVRDGVESLQRAKAEFDSGFDIVGVLPGGTRQRAYSETLTAPDATAPVAWSISAGALPAGWAINSATGEISGTATAAVGYYTFTIQADDDAGLTATREYTVGIGNLVSLLPCDGADGSTTFTDTTGKAWTVTGNAQVDTGDADFPTGAGQFDGNGDYLTGPTSSDWAFGTGDFTIGCWVKHAAATGGGVNNDRIVIGRFGTPAFVAFLTNNNLTPALWDGTSQRNSSIVVPANTKTWVSWTRKGGVLRIHVGGVLGYEGANTINFTDTAGRYVGGNPGSRYFNGRMEDLLVVKGAALYVEEYTPPVAHF